LRVSAKTGLGVESVLEGVVARIPPPPPYVPNEKMRALAFDSYYDSFRGVVSLIAVVEGEIKKGEPSRTSSTKPSLTDSDSSDTGDQITSTTTGLSYPILDLGILSPREISIAENPAVASRTLRKGMVGWVVCAMKDVKDAHLGDTFHHTHAPMPPLESFEPLKSMVFAGCYPMEPGGFPKLEDAIKRVCPTRCCASPHADSVLSHSSPSPTEVSPRTVNRLPSLAKGFDSASTAVCTWTFSVNDWRTSTPRRSSSPVLWCPFEVRSFSSSPLLSHCTSLTSFNHSSRLQERYREDH